MSAEHSDDDMPDNPDSISYLAHQELQELKEKLSVLTRHSLRTPLTVIDGNARRLQRHAETFSPDEVKARTEIIRSTVEKMVELVEHSIELTQMVTCVRDFPPNTLPLRGLVQQIVEEHEFDRPAANLVAWLNECPEVLVADRRLVELILDKLLTIGGELITNHGRLDLVVWSEGEYANITLKAIFEARSLVDVRHLSERLEAERERVSPAMAEGVNLNLIRLLVEQHDGELDIDDCEDRIEFEIRFPVRSAEENPSAPLVKPGIVPLNDFNEGAI